MSALYGSTLYSISHPDTQCSLSPASRARVIAAVILDDFPEQAGPDSNSEVRLNDDVI
jgi:hypothetical protein